MYERILLHISGDYRDDAKRVFHFLLYAGRPLDLREVAEVIPICPNQDNKWDEDRRLPEPRDLLTICSSLVSVVTTTIRVQNREIRFDQIRLAHSSVRDYLMSNGISQGTAVEFGVDGPAAHSSLAEISLTYLLYVFEQGNPHQASLDQFPLLRYASQYWMSHVIAAEKGSACSQDTLNNMSRLFDDHNKCYENWIRLWDPDEPSAEPRFSKMPNEIAQPLYYASKCGCLIAVKQLLGLPNTDVNCIGGKFGSALQAAAREGHSDIVGLLLEHGADPTLQGGIYGYAHLAALYAGCEVSSSLLINSFPKSSPETDKHRSSLSWAAEGGILGTLQLAFDVDENAINCKDALGRIPLMWAAAEGRTEAVKFLLDHGSDIENSDHDGLTSLIRAAKRGKETVVSLLLDRGADVNSKDNRGHSALIWAAKRGQLATVKLLVDRGADLKKECNKGYTAFAWARKRTHESIAQLLHDRSGEDKDTDSVVQRWWGHTPWSCIIATVLDYQALAKAAAASGCYKILMNTLLDLGADIKARGPNGFTVLIWAAEGGHESVIELLITKGSELEAVCDEGSTALLYASRRGFHPIVQHLVNAKANVEAYDRFWRQRPLMWATKRNYPEVVAILMAGGANVNEVDRDGNTALHWAAKRGYEDMVKFLIAKGADVEASNQEGDTALSCATKLGFQGVASILGSDYTGAEEAAD